MPSLQEIITEKFLATLVPSEDVTPEMIASLRELLESDKKTKVDDFVEVFTTPPGGNVA